MLDPQKRTLSRNGLPIPLTPKAFDVLLFLAQGPNRLITKDELLQAVWGDTFVEEGNLTQYISHLRKALADNSEDSRLIVTISRKGYQFTADVVAEGADIPKRDAPQGLISGVSTTGIAAEAKAGNESLRRENQVQGAVPKPGIRRRMAGVLLPAAKRKQKWASRRHLNSIPIFLVTMKSLASYIWRSDGLRML